MVMAYSVEEFATNLHSVQRFGELRQASIDFFLANRPVMMSYHHFPPPGATDFGSAITIDTYGFPEDWVKLYISKKFYEADPIPKHALSTTEPFWWSEAEDFPQLKPAERAYLEELSNANLGEGLAIPVFGPFGRNGYMGLGFGKKTVTLTVGEISTLQWACQLGHQKYCDLLRAKLPDDVVLSNRECEILAWVAKGKSNSVIAEIIGISSYTVDTYLRRIFVKLGVSDRVTAALRGIAIGAVT